MKSRRQARVLELIYENSIETQEELLLRLKNDGFNVTQATVSRDIKELGLYKKRSADNKYYYAAPYTESREYRDIRAFFTDSVVSVKAAQNIVVIKTHAGMANALCASIDSMNLKGVAGTLAGDDTIFIACDSGEIAAALAVEFMDKM